MKKNRHVLCLVLALLFVSACAISKKKEVLQRSDEDAGNTDLSDASISDDAGDRSSAPDARGPGNTGGTTANGGSGGTVGPELEIAVCGNGRIEEGEECDDGNLNSRDGCTTLCDFSCEEDADCDDLNDCNGVEICTRDHACDDSDPDLEDGTSCGEDKSCWRGVCVQSVCGDAERDRGEVCDDGNLDPNDGCTPDCELTCEDDSDCANKETCLSDRLCRDDGRHGGLRVCVGGTPLEDKTACEITDAKTKALCGDSDVDRDGWCIDGVCTCAGCGDGQVDDNEACDDGALNGTADAPNNCALNCQVVACGNGVLEGDESCDDGNRRRLDGCDPQCQYEFAHRLIGMQLLKEVEVPKWCKHRSNRFADAFAEEVMIMGVVPLNMLDVVSRQLSMNMAQGDAFYLLHIMDSDDTSMETIDDDISVGLYYAYPHMMTDERLDAPVIINPNQLDRDTLLPANYHAVRAIQAGGGRVISREPTTVEMVDVTGDFALMRDFMLQLVFDLTTLSRPSVEPLVERDTISVSQALRIPEVAGRDPMGMFCGSIDKEFIEQPMLDASTPGSGGFSTSANFCCKNRGDDAGSPYRYCDEDESTDQCDSVADLIHQGCSACIDMTDISNIAAVLDKGTNCDLMKENPGQCFKIIDGIEFDLDSDGDGENDSWSALFGFETERVRIYDVAGPISEMHFVDRWRTKR